MAALATVTELADDLGITIAGGSADETRAQSYLDRLSATARRLARQTFDVVNDDVAKLRGNWTGVLQLPERPVIDVTSVLIEDQTLTEDVDWRLAAGDRLVRLSIQERVIPQLPRGNWGGDLATVTVTYSHGGVPEDVKGIVIAAAGRLWANPDMALYERVGSYGIGFSNATAVELFTDLDRELLEDYQP